MLAAFGSVEFLSKSSNRLVRVARLNVMLSLAVELLEEQLVAAAEVGVVVGAAAGAGGAVLLEASWLLANST